MTNEVMSDCLSLEDVAKYLDVSVNTARDMMKQCKDIKEIDVNGGSKKKLYSIKEVNRIRDSKQQQQLQSLCSKAQILSSKHSPIVLGTAFLLSIKDLIIQKIEGEQKIEFVYVFKDDKYYKIGKTKNIQQRINALRTANIDISFVMSCQTTDAFTLEYALHKHFRDKNIDLEWFDLDDNDIQELLALGFNYAIYE